MGVLHVLKRGSNSKIAESWIPHSPVNCEVCHKEPGIPPARVWRKKKKATSTGLPSNQEKAVTSKISRVYLKLQVSSDQNIPLFCLYTLVLTTYVCNFLNALPGT